MEERVSYTEENRKWIGARLEEGLSLLRGHYSVKEQPSDPALADPVIGGRPHRARRYDIEGLGNLLLMTAAESEENQLSSFVIMPYTKNLPMLSADYVYNGENRFMLLEIYDLSVFHDAVYDAGIKAFGDFAEKMEGMQDIPPRPGWYDGIRPVCCVKAFGRDQDERSVQYFKEFLEIFIDMAEKSPALTGDDLRRKWEINRDYADRLIDEGGVSTDLFTKALGAENTRRFFHEVFFGTAHYRSV